MNKLLLFLYGFSPRVFKFLLKKYPHLSLNLNNHIYLLVKRKKMSALMPYLNLDLLSLLGIELHRFSYIFFENFYGYDVNLNKIVLNICNQLIDFSEEELNKDVKLQYFFSGQQNWVYSLIDLTTGPGQLADMAYDNLMIEIEKDDAFLNSEVVSFVQLSSLNEHNIKNISYLAFLLTFLSYKE